MLKWAADDFRQRGIDSPRLDAELLLAQAIGTTRMQLILDGQRPLVADELARFRDFVKRRRNREPIAYIRGDREFYGRSFKVDARVLVPRPETEHLVDVALARSASRSMSLRALDVCTGSGCVAITIAKERPTSVVIATDISLDALAVARDNALRLGAYNVSFVEADLFPRLDRFDLIVSNPPYIASAEIETLAPDIAKHEPRIALDGGADGLDFVRRIIEQSVNFLDDLGVLVLEIGNGDAQKTASLLEGAFSDIRIQRDYSQIERIVSGVFCR